MRLQFGDSDSSDFDDDTSGLPFPEPLSRSSFLNPDFDPASFLSSLKNRHQSLEDLRQELRDLDQSLTRELLDLVNENYQDFLSLGSALRGGEEKVEQVRVGLLAFQRDTQAIRDRVESRRQDVEQLLKEKRRLRQERNTGQVLLDFADRLEELEQRLLLGDSAQQQDDSSDDFDSESDALDSEADESDDDELSDDAQAAPSVSLKKLKRHIEKYVYLTALTQRVGVDHPFFLTQQPRMTKVRSTILLDLKTAMEQAKQAGDKKDAKTLAVLRLYNLMGEETSAATTLKNLRL